MAFKIKDLMVNLVSADQAYQRKIIAARCPHLSIDPTTGPPFDLIGYPESISVAILTSLKEQLKAQLVEVERMQAASDRSLLPKSVEEVDMLTQKLADALEELTALRVELLKKPRKVAVKYKKGPPAKKK